MILLKMPCRVCDGKDRYVYNFLEGLEEADYDYYMCMLEELHVRRGGWAGR